MKSVFLFCLFIAFLIGLGLVGSIVAFPFAGAGLSISVLLERNPFKGAMYGFVVGVVVYILIKEKLDNIKRQ